MTTNRDSIGMIGVGRMGGAIAHRLLDCAVPITCYDLDPDRVRMFADRGAATAASIEDLTEQCGRVCITVVDHHQAADVVGQLLAVRHPPELIVLHSTIPPSIARALAEQAWRHQVGLVDAPVSGGVDRAADGTLATMLGGRVDAVDAACLVVGTYCADVLRVGQAGAGQLAKITNNLMSIVNTVVVNEALRLAEAHGFEPADALRAASLGSGASNAVTTWAWRSEMVTPGATNPLRPMARKDLRLALELAADAGLELPLTEAAIRVFDELDGCTDAVRRPSLPVGE